MTVFYLEKKERSLAQYLDSHFYEVLHLIVVLFLFLLLVLGFLVVVDHLALIELHTNSVIVTTVGVTVAPVTEATAFDLVALAFAVLSLFARLVKL